MLRILLVMVPLLLWSKAPAPRASLVEMAPLTKGKVNRLQNFVGTLYFNQKSNLASESAGKVLKVYFDNGDTVKKGTLLVTLDSSILDKNIMASQASLREAEANYRKSNKDLKRYKTLLADQSIAHSEYDAIAFATTGLKSRTSALQAGLDAQRIEKNKKKIYAPYDGIITSKMVELGEWVKTGEPIAQLVNPYVADITINIPEQFIHNIKKGDAIKVMVANEALTGKVKAIIPIGDKNTRTFPLKVTLKSKKILFEGMEVNIKLPNAQLDNALLIPRDGVIKRFGQQIVFTNSDGKAMMIPVSIVGYFQDKIAIESPMLKEGMPLVIKGNERIFPNQPIQATKP
ncbi:MAG: Probable Co/Zn/Cd efflux system membrane fusion protein [uncultured Sulfurovum sp.]|uniref:Probable Co/Zn/Cd efflux system membrane fusion protein n=1 Tax=uncultured Sulfurovum sp. TaxID=269237 RepID=A0A6S6SD36_9BACT|nr:MAG: Probable Co/Zn/Cd efflux system membrane fusion protein [uncultured Sulfurovum sp.]